MLQRCREYMVQNNMTAPGDTVVCGVSGGTDSVCLLDILNCLSGEMGFTLCAAHYNHRLRGAESDGDESFVAELCQSMGVPLLIGSGDVAAQAAKTGCGLEETARKMRYAFFREAMEYFSATKTATAHNADDNLETLIMHLVRGAGLRGLGGIPPVRGEFIRPVLFAPRSEIEAWCDKRRLSHREDSTNRDESYTRNRIRARILPVLRDMNPGVAAAAVQMCAGLRADEEFLTEASKISGYIQISSLGSKPLALRTIRDGYEAVAGQSLTARQLEAVYSLCLSPNPSGELSLPGGVCARREYGVLKFSADDGEKAEFNVILEPGKTADTGKFLTFCKISQNLPESLNFRDTFAIKHDMIDGALVLRSRQTGDKITLKGRPEKSLKKLFIDEKIPARERQSVPVIADDRGVLWVYGFGPDQRAASPAEGEYIIVSLRPAGEGFQEFVKGMIQNEQSS